MDLFSVFNEEVSTPPPVEPVEPAEPAEPAPSAVSTEEAKNNKRAASDSPETSEKKVKEETSSSNDVSNQAKKPKLNNIIKAENDSLAPIMGDTFELEVERSVPSASVLDPSVSSDGTSKETPENTSLTLRHPVKHEVAYPPGYNYTPIEHHKVKDPARTYPFTLDPFQEKSIACIDRNESVLVSAHTSAGKTVVAEYAIAQSLRAKQRVVYTSPIKALSNQKFRDLKETFGDVGLMTGDVTQNPDAGCIVMTTEILRSMLYKGDQLIREVGWVIFDEVHYMRDKERGVVWEETIIMLPDNVRFVFLSATIPNAAEFARWICRIHLQPCHVVYTSYRPTPLQHYLFPAGDSGIHLVVDEKGNFREDNFQRAMSAIADNTGDDPNSVQSRGKNGKTFKGGNKNTSDIYKIVKMIWLKKYNPVIVFSFSKRECETLAKQISRMDFATEDEKTRITDIFNACIEVLPEADKDLPQIKALLPFLKRGIGIHHSGLLPILKEIVEILFQNELLKVLFATETFSIGLNMPAKTVVFTSVRKWDGQLFRWVSGGEYVQMAGRAGRRGKDDRGIVIMMIDEKMEPEVAKGMVKGQADRLDSAFHLGYNMILSLLRVGGTPPEELLARSFFQFQTAAAVPEMVAKRDTLTEELKDIHVPEEAAVRELYGLRKQLDMYGNEMQHVITHPSHVMPFLQPGRLIKIAISMPSAQNGEPVDFGWAIVVSSNKRASSRRGRPEHFSDHESWVVEALLEIDADSPSQKIRARNPILPDGIRPKKEGRKAKVEILPITLNSITALSNVRVRVPKEMRSPAQKAAVVRMIAEVQKRFPDGVPLLDPIENMKIYDDDFSKLLRKIEIFEAKLLANPLAKSPDLPAYMEKFAKKLSIEEELKRLNSKIADAEAIIQEDDFKKRKRVLRRLGFTSQSDVIELKGRVACEISTGDELLLTELVFNGNFNSLSPAQTAALLSCFVFEEKSKEVPNLRPELAEPLKALQQQAVKIAKVCRDCKMDVVEKDYVESFRSELMEVVYAWCSGASFTQICTMTDVYEGSLIRMFRRLEEMINQMVEAAGIMGNQDLKEKMEKALALVHRDIVAENSIYLREDVMKELEDMEGKDQ